MAELAYPYPVCEKKNKKKTDCTDQTYLKELQMRGGTEDNSKIIFLSLNENLCCDPTLELSKRDGSNDGSQNVRSFCSAKI